jgi:3-dehydroquinate synthase
MNPVLVPVSLANHTYNIHIGEGSWSDPSVWSDLPRAATAVIVSNVTVAPLYAERLKQALQLHYPRVLLVILPDGEIHKSWDSMNQVFTELLSQACDRQTVLFALGGGVVGDLTGFIAACYMRGVPFVQVPTSLLAQVDSSVGGKTAINHPLGKNMIGAFYQPSKVVCDLSVLRTLAPREISAGLAEIIKYGPIADAEFFHWLEVHMEALRSLDMDALAYAVKRSCEIKAHVVCQDERESGLRAILNFGHTFGHAIESGLGYGQWLHGEAVACGMVMASELSVRLGYMPASFVSRIMHLIERAGLPVLGPDLSPERYLELMQVDKKAQAGEIRFVLIESLGCARTGSAPDDMVMDVIRTHTA